MAVTTSSIFDERHGVFHLESAGDEIQRLATKGGWHSCVIDTAGVTDREGFMNVIAEALDLPRSLLTSWDALDGCMRALDLDEPDGLLVLWDHWGGFAEADPDAFEMAVEVFQDACVAWRDDEFQGTVLLRGVGPETSLESW
jgi:hypothetical protein